MHLRDIPSNFRASLGSSVNFCQLYKCLQELLQIFCASVGSSVNIRCRCRIFCQRWSTLRAPEGLSVKLHQLSMSSWNLMSTLRQLSVRPWDLPSTSFYFPCIRRTILQLSVCQLLSIFRASVGLSVNILSTFVQPRDLLSTSAHFTCGCGSFREISSTFHLCVGHSIIILCVRGTFYPNLSFSINIMPVGPSENVPCGHRTHCQVLSTFCASEGQSITFLCISGTFHQRLSTFRAAAGTSVNFLYIRGTFRQHFLRPLNLPSTSVNI